MPLCFKPRVLIMLFLGFASGLPLPLTMSTLSVYLYDYGFTLSSIGLFGLAGICYSLKPFWSPFIDNLSPPFPFGGFGKRKGWLLLVQILLVMAVLSLSVINPQDYLMLVAIIIFTIGFLASTQDIIIDAFRIESLKEEEQGMGVANYILGYRIAILVSTAGVLFIAHIYSWKIAFIAIAACLLVGVIATLFAKEPVHIKVRTVDFNDWFMHAFIKPFQEFTTRDHWILVLLFVVLYKLSDAYLGMMTNPFLLEIGFDKMEIAQVVKVFGLIGTLVGAYLGGYLVKKLNMYKLLFYTGVICGLSNLLFIYQYWAGHNLNVLMIVNSVENFTGGISSTILIAYLSGLCNKQFTATQYALLSSLASLGRSTISSTSGWVAESYGWVDFFIFSAILTLPALILIQYIKKQDKE